MHGALSNKEVNCNSMHKEKKNKKTKNDASNRLGKKEGMS